MPEDSTLATYTMEATGSVHLGTVTHKKSLGCWKGTLGSVQAGSRIQNPVAGRAESLDEFSRSFKAWMPGSPGILQS